MTVGTQKKLLIDSPIPTLVDITNRMEKKIGRASILVKSIISPCAEEAERIVCDLITSSILKTPVSIKKIKWARYRGNRFMIRGYDCPKCGQGEIRLYSNYCPGCGKPIEWT